MYQTKGVNDKNIKPKALEYISAAEECGCVNFGDVKSGSILEYSVEEIKKHITDKSRLRGVLDSREKVTKFLRMIKEKDLGLSLVISGLLDEVLAACKEAGVKPHTINFSLGVWGKKELLPPEEILSVTTMCGHHMISPGIVKKHVEMVKNRQETAEEAGKALGRLCPCGIFNHIRAAELIAEMAASEIKAAQG